MPDKLVSMKMARAAREESAPTAVIAGSSKSDAPIYPWGLELTLDREALDKLGIADALPKVGSSLQLRALVDVTRVSESETDGGKTCSVSLQITDLGLQTAGKKSAAEVLYDK